MAINTKGKRKIVIRDQTYYWWVKDIYDYWVGLRLFIIPEHGNWSISYDLQQSNEDRTVRLHMKNGQNGINLKCEQLEEQDYKITPKDVQYIIEWCLDSTLTNRTILHAFGKEVEYGFRPSYRRAFEQVVKFINEDNHVHI